MAVLASDPIPTFREDEDGNDVWIYLFVFGKSLRNKQRPSIHLAQKHHSKSIERLLFKQGEL